MGREKGKRVKGGWTERGRGGEKENRERERGGNRKVREKGGRGERERTRERRSSEEIHNLSLEIFHCLNLYN